MVRGSISLSLAIAMVWGALLLASYYWTRYARRPGETETLPSLSGWAFRGMAAPLLAVGLWNLLVLGGLLDGVAPIVPGLGIRANRPPAPEAAWTIAVAHTAIPTASYWGALSLAWLLPRVRRGDLEKGELRILLGLYAVVFVLPAAALVRWLGPSAGGFAGMLALWPLVHFGSPEKPPTFPSYGRAIARMKFGKYADAEAEVLAQLEACQTDFQGWMLLAQLYAEHFNEVAEADATIWELASQPGLSAYEVSQAFTRLADWHLNLAKDPHAARRALEEVVARCAGTPFAVTASHRIAQLPRDRAELLEREAPRVVALPALSETAPVADPADRRGAAREKARRLRERITENPSDSALREELAVLRVRDLGEVSEGIRDLEELLKSPDAPADRKPAWLAHLAGWHLKHRNDPGTARRYLERLIADHPDSPHSYSARGQIWSIEQDELASRVVEPEDRPAPRIVVRVPPPPPPPPA